MSVLIDTSLGDMVVDLYTDDCPIASKNFLKLCKIKYYNNCLFFNVQENYLAQTGDPTNTGQGGESIYGKIYGEQARFFEDEIREKLTHNKKGLLSYASVEPNTNGSQFFFSLRAEDLGHLDKKHTIFGEVVEGFDTLDQINGTYCDEDSRPYQNIRVRHTIVIDDPFDDPPGLEVPPASPAPQKDVKDGPIRIEDDEAIDEYDGRTAEEIEESVKEKEAQSRAEVLEMIGDFPTADARAEDNVLFVCKLNPVTEDDDLELIFSRFGKVKKAEVIRDWKTGDSLQYAFVEFEEHKSCEQAYFKMDNVLIDDRRIHVDFSQSVVYLHKQYRSGDHFSAADPGWRPGMAGPPAGGGGGRDSDGRRSKKDGRPMASGIGSAQDLDGGQYDLVMGSDVLNQLRADTRIGSRSGGESQQNGRSERPPRRDDDRGRNRERDRSREYDRERGREGQSHRSSPPHKRSRHDRDTGRGLDSVRGRHSEHARDRDRDHSRHVDERRHRHSGDHQRRDSRSPVAAERRR